MIPSINRYRLDTKTESYGDALTAFGREAYEWAESFDRKPLFKGERFYWANERHFLGRECGQAMVSAIDGTIYKISFRFHDTQTEACVALREHARNFISSELGKHTELREVGPDHHVVIWQTESGNVMLELDSFDTEVVLTSNSVVHAKKITRFDRFFGNTS